MTGAVVRNDRIAGTQGQNRLGFDVAPDHPAVQRAVDHPWRVRSVMAQGPDECLRAPAPKRRVIDKALPAWGQRSRLTP